MVQIKYIGSHRPKGMIVDVDEDVARDAIDSGEFIRVGEIIEEVKPEKIIKQVSTSRKDGKYWK